MPPFLLIFILIIAVPLLEIYLLIRIGSVIGAMTTLSVVILTAALGAMLLRQQGIATMTRYQASLARGELPATEMLEGVILLIGGILLLTPGFLTDVVGFFCLLPQSRRVLIGVVWSRITVYAPMHSPHSNDQRANEQSGRVIEGEIIEKRTKSS